MLRTCSHYILRLLALSQTCTEIRPKHLSHGTIDGLNDHGPRLNDHV
jgi:hypothetical protein